ncbi:MAG TPA: hypothetical protein VG986_13985 [Pseudolabrys sp.]|nr:hypothetical protein [Pseudolabrys sp.]
MRMASIIVAALIAAMAVEHAQGNALATVITLSCDGKITDARGSEAKPEPISKMGVVVNLTERTVAGFGGIVAHIDKADAVYVSFSGQGQLTAPGASGNSISVGDMSVMGDLDRVTGAVSATTMTKATTYSYELFCKPTKSLF